MKKRKKQIDNLQGLEKNKNSTSPQGFAKPLENSTTTSIKKGTTNPDSAIPSVLPVNDQHEIEVIMRNPKMYKQLKGDGIETVTAKFKAQTDPTQ